MTNLGVGFGGYTYMQEINKDVCSAIPQNTTGRLRDRRDNKLYFVTKINNGLCWMSQNLDLDLNGVTLTPQDSDVTSDWKSTTGASALWSDTDATIIKYYDPGAFVFKDGKTSTVVSADLLTKDWTLPLTDVGLDDTWTVTYDDFFVQATQYVGTDGQSICSKTAGSMYGDTNQAYAQCRIYYYKYALASSHYDAQYLQGNYYSFNAATAGSGQNKTTANQNADDSICPKGWKLPTSNNSNPGSFGALGLTTSNIIKSPYYFIYGGYVNSGSLQNAGSNGYYWSSTAYNAADAYNLSFNSSNVIPSYSFYRYSGFSVRCVAR